MTKTMARAPKEQLATSPDRSRPWQNPTPLAADYQPKWIGQFDTFGDWLNHATRALSGDPPAFCVDAKGRRCWNGGDFQRANNEEAFPVRYFREFQLVLGDGNAADVGAMVYDQADERHIGKFERMTKTGNVVVRWPSKIISYVPPRDLRIADPENY